LTGCVGFFGPYTYVWNENFWYKKINVAESDVDNEFDEAAIIIIAVL